ncbi:MAG TPA: MmcQ/YjbR family DNA-binding protein [Rhizomicrobium sp.]|jgi:hypothetical protein
MTNSRDDIREIALAFEGVREVDHWNRPAFRTTRRIFAVIRPDGLWLHLPEERKAFLLAVDSTAFVEYRWGRRADVIVQPDQLSRRELEALLREAYDHAKPAAKAPRRVRTSKPAVKLKETVTRLKQKNPLRRKSKASASESKEGGRSRPRSKLRERLTAAAHRRSKSSSDRR